MYVSPGVQSGLRTAPCQGSGTADPQLRDADEGTHATWDLVVRLGIASGSSNSSERSKFDAQRLSPAALEDHGALPEG